MEEAAVSDHALHRQVDVEAQEYTTLGEEAETRLDNLSVL